MRTKTSEKKYNENLPAPKKPPNSKLSNAEWEEYVSIFPNNGWGALTGDEVLKAEQFFEAHVGKHLGAVARQECLLCGEQTSKYVLKFGLCSRCRQLLYNKSTNHICKPFEMFSDDLASIPCVRCGTEGVLSPESCMCKSCHNKFWNPQTKTYKEFAFNEAKKAPRVVRNRMDGKPNRRIDTPGKLAKIGIVRCDFGFGIR